MSQFSFIRKDNAHVQVPREMGENLYVPPPSRHVFVSPPRRALPCADWLYPQSDNPVTYQYCVDISGLSTGDIADGLNCSLTAKATFNVSGPTATITPETTHWTVSRPISYCDSTATIQMLMFGKLNRSASTTCNLVIATSGITFDAAVNLSSGNSGQTAWVQVIRKNTISGTTILSQTFTSDDGTGLDNSFPYNSGSPDPVDATETSTNDSPGKGLEDNEVTVTRAFKARMYLIWTSQIADSIPVPLGYVEWTISGTATADETATPPWSLTSTVPTKKAFHVSQDTGTKTHGLPTWSRLVTNTNTSAAVEEEEEEEEEQ